MNMYEKQFAKYSEIARRGYTDYQLLIDAVKGSMVERQGTPIANAIIVMGFSGNGKSTLIRNFLEKNPDYVVISMDTIQRNLFDHGITDPKAVVRDFGKAIEEACSSGKNIIFDGNFLNLLTRMSLADTLKSFNYNINVVDITGIIQKTLPNRIMDEASRTMKIRINSSNVREYEHHPLFVQISTIIRNFFESELKRSAFEEQIEYGVLDLGIDKMFDHNSSFEEIRKIAESNNK